MNVLGYGKLWITTAKDRFNGWWTSKELDLVKRTLVAKLINFAKKIADRISKSATKNMDKGTAKRMAQLEDGMDPGKVYSDRNIKRTDRAAAIETKIDKAIDVVKDKIDGPAMPKQDLDKVLKAATEKTQAADPMAMTVGVIGDNAKGMDQVKQGILQKDTPASSGKRKASLQRRKTREKRTRAFFACV